MAFRGKLGIRTVRLAPSEEVPARGGFEFLMLASGCAYWLEGEIGIMLQPDELLVVNGEQFGCLRGAKYEPSIVNVFSIRLEWLQGIISIEEQLQIRRSLKDLSLPAVISKNHPATQAYRSQRDELGTSDLFSRARFLEVLALLVRSRTCSMKERDGAPSCSCEERMGRYFGSLSLLEIRDLSVSRLAQICGCSARHAGRVFRRIYGLSLRSKQVEIRMDQATELLEVGGLTVERVAELCGYTDAQHFRVAFRRCFGVAPTEWTAHHRGHTMSAGVADVLTT